MRPNIESIEQVEKVVGEMKNLPMIGRRIISPREILILDGVMIPKSKLGTGKSVIGRAQIDNRPMSRERLVILTPVSDEKTIVHEVLHISGIYNETVTAWATDLVLKRLEMQGNIGKVFPGRPRPRYTPRPITRDAIQAKLGGSNPRPNPSQVKYYVLVNE